MISHTVQWCIGRWAQQLRVWERDKFEETSLHWWWDGLCNETVVGWSARGMWLINCYDDTPLPVYLSLYGSCCWPSTVSSISWIIRGSVRYSSVVVQFIRIITTCVNCLLVLNTFLSLFWWVGNLRQSSTTDRPTPAQRINCAGIHLSIRSSRNDDERLLARFAADFCMRCKSDSNKFSTWSEEEKEERKRNPNWLNEFRVIDEGISADVTCGSGGDSVGNNITVERRDIIDR